MVDSKKPVRVRFAPSPTGLLHIGGLRTALYNYLFARRHGGTFILRIEDTDRERFVEEAERDILESLEWAGLEHDEGPLAGGPHEPYYQSRRAEAYLKHAQKLLDAGYAYYAFDSVEELESMKNRLRSEQNPSPKYDAATREGMKNSLSLSDDEVLRRLDAGEPHVVRLKVPAGETVWFEDAIRGRVSFETSEIDDQVLLKSDGMPTYHLANVVDDHLMGVTHVIRGEEWLPSTPKHMLLYRSLGWEPPQMAHLPLILSPTGGKLSKRNAEAQGIPVSVRQYRESGYESRALLNFLAFLGWNPGDERELFTVPELTEAFSLDRVGSAGVQFNLDKLKWYNEQYIRKMSQEELVERARPHLEAQGITAEERYLRNVAELMQERISFVREIATSAAYFFRDPESYEEKAVQKRWKENSGELLSDFADRLERLDEPFTAETIESELRSLSDENGVSAGAIIHPVRLAVSGVSFGPSLFHMMEVLGRDACVRRVRRAVEQLSASVRS